MNSKQFPQNLTSTETRLYILECVQSRAYIISHAVVIILTFLSTLFGNILILISIVRFSPAVRGMNLMIANLAIADLLIVFRLLMYPVELLMPALSYNIYFCLSGFGIMLVSFTASLLTLTHISIDRFMGIIFPMKHFVDSKKKRIYYMVICLNWMASFSVNLPLLLFSDISSDDRVPCTNGAIISLELNIFLVCGMFILMTINTLIYIAIGWKIAFRKRILNLKRSKIIRTRMMIIVYAGFIVCWSPLFIILTYVLTDRNREEYIFCPAEYLLLTGYINSGMNWVIYGLADRKFRNAFNILLCQRARNTLCTLGSNTVTS